MYLNRHQWDLELQSKLMVLPFGQKKWGWHDRCVQNLRERNIPTLDRVLAYPLGSNGTTSFFSAMSMVSIATSSSGIGDDWKR